MKVRRMFEPKATKGYRSMTYCGCCEAGVITVWVNITESVMLAPAQSHFQPGYTWSSRIRSLCGIGRDGLMYTITHTRWSSAAECYTIVSFDTGWQGLRLIKQMCPAANNVHVRGVFKFTQAEMTPLASHRDACLKESSVWVAPPSWDDKISR